MIIKEKVEEKLYKVSRPERYTGNEWNVVKKEWKDQIKILFSFPDVYEIGMSHLGLKILYHKLNQEKDILCERTFSPWPDMEDLLRKNNLPLYALESGHEVKDFDIFAITLQYEMSYTNILNLLDLAGLNIRSEDRDNNDPLVIAGGSTVYNPEPLAPFIDLFFIGEAEKSIVSLVRKYNNYNKENLSRKKILTRLNQIPGVYVPSLYQVEYKEEKIKKFTPISDSIKTQINRQVVKDLDNAFYPEDFIVPYMDIVHNRAVLEIARGCSRGCRFCAAGMTYRPVRERKTDTLIKLADNILKSTGYDEISLTSLSTMDYTDIENLVQRMADRYKDDKISISLPSLRIDQFSVNLADEVQKVRKSGLTFAPEAGSQRLRNVINKGVSEKDLYEAVEAAFKSGWHRIKLYFMIGLPTETEEDLAGIVNMVHKVRHMGRKIVDRRVEVNVGISTYIPKPFTPFQWVRMIDKDEINSKIKYLQKNITGKGFELNWNNPDLSILEGVFSRGDRRLAEVLETAWKKGAKFDSWREHFKNSVWQEAFKDNDLETAIYTGSRNLEDMLPWSHINTGVSEEFLKREYRKAFQEEISSDCRFNTCTGCGVCFDLDTGLELVGRDYNVNQS
ncbi:MAG: TIGR03960 family B12-binding radical SAM protein [Halanaerobiales bacterium]